MSTPANVVCRHCGAENRPRAKFCGRCGALLAVDVTCRRCGAHNPGTQRFCDECGGELDASTEAAQPADRPAPTTLADGRYALGRMLGEGAGKRVYLATDTRLQREVAAALLKAAESDVTAIQRARREAAAMAKLGDHANIVNVYDFGEQAGQQYLISQYMPGGDLYSLLSQAADHRLAVEEVVRIGSDIAGGLAYAHSNGVVHRDIKPQNVWLAPDGTAKIGDFGLAYAEDGAHVTREGTMLGTVAYVSPEQGLGRGSDARSDIYSLGALLYELLCGIPPFVGESTAAVVSQHVSTPPIAPSAQRGGVPPALDQLLLKMLAKSPDARPQHASEVRDALGAIAAATSGVHTPAHDMAALDRITAGTFLGRERETRQLRTAVDDVLGSRGRLVLVSGESGIGKTRLATDVTAYATLRGAQVLWGRCYAGAGAPAYWPWAQVIRDYTHDHDAESVASTLGSGAFEIAQIVSEVREQMPGIPEPATVDPDQARFRLFDSISRFLVGISEHQPLAIVLEDLQQADLPSLMLLAFVARELSRARVLLLATYRDDELVDGHYLNDILTELSKERGYTHIKLRGLSDQHITAMVEAVLQQPLESADELRLADTVCRESEGNPYFAEEIIRHLIDSGALDWQDGRWIAHPRDGSEPGIPRGVRQVISHRLAKLPATTLELLSTAAVIGREFDMQMLTLVNGLGADEALARMQPALDGAILRAAEEPGRYVFAHGATREALYDTLPELRRCRLHVAVGEAIERLYEERIESHLSAIAHHLAKAAPQGDVAKAADYAWWAGERAAATYAYEDAVNLFQTALRLFDTLPEVVPRRRCDLLLALGDARWRSGAAEQARNTFAEAASVARDLALNEHYARAALGYGGHAGGFTVVDRSDELLTAMLCEALQLLPARDSELRVRVLARLALELRCKGDLAEADRTSAQALEMAERVGDTKVQLLAMHSREWSTVGPGMRDEAIASGAEMARLARIAGDYDMEFEGHHLRLIGLAQLGDFQGVDEEIAACGRLAGSLRQPRYLWQAAVFRTMRALMRGRHKDAARLAQTALSIGHHAEHDLATVVFNTHSFLARLADGSLEQLSDAGREAAAQYSHHTWDSLYAWLLAEIGNVAEAHARLAEFAADGFESLRCSSDGSTSISPLSIASLATGDRDIAGTLYELLAPYANRCTVVLAGAACLGSNHAFLAFAAAAAGRHDDAARHFDLALARNSEIGCDYLTPRVCYEFARMLLDRPEPGDREKATAIAAHGLSLANRMAMPREAERLTRLRQEHPDRPEELKPRSGWSALDAVAQSVEQDRPDLRGVAAPDGTVTIMFSDIEGSTVLAEQLGDERWLQLLRRHNALVREHLATHRGFEVKSQGDGFMVAFDSARSALRCAVAIQRDLATRCDDSGNQVLRVRIGLHTGEAIREQEDFFGHTVILAARIGAKADGNEILVSAVLRGLLAGSQEFQFGGVREEQLKGLRDPQRLYEVRWR